MLIQQLNCPLFAYVTLKLNDVGEVGHATTAFGDMERFSLLVQLFADQTFEFWGNIPGRHVVQLGLEDDVDRQHDQGGHVPDGCLRGRVHGVVVRLRVLPQVSPRATHGQRLHDRVQAPHADGVGRGHQSLVLDQVENLEVGQLDERRRQHHQGVGLQVQGLQAGQAADEVRETGEPVVGHVQVDERLEINKRPRQGGQTAAGHGQRDQAIETANV